MSARLGYGIVLGFAFSCQSPIAQAPSAAPAPAPSASNSDEAPDAPSTDTAEERSNGIIGVMSVSDPRALQRWVGTLLDPKSEIAVVANMPLETLAAQLVGANVGELCNFDLPLHVAFVDADGKDMVLSIGAKGSLETLERKLSDAVKLTRISPDAYAIESRAGEAACELRRAGAEARFVCSKHAEQVTKHAAYLIEQGSKARKSTLIRFEVERDFYRRLVKKDPSSADDDPKAKFFDELMGGFGRETVSGAISLTVTGGGPVLGFESQFGKVENIFSTLLVTSEPRKATEVASFWRLPKDSSAAMHFTGGDPEKTRRAAAPFFEKWIQIDSPELDDQARAQSKDAMARIFFTGGPVDFAFGMDLEKAKRALDAWDKKRATLGKTQHELASWGVIGVEQSASDLIDAMQKSDEAERQGRKRASAAGRAQPPRPHDRYVTTTVEVKMPAGAGLPKGSAHWSSTRKPNPAYAPKDPATSPPGTQHVSHVYVVPDGTRSWIGFSNDDALVRKKLKEVVAGKSTLSPTGPLELVSHARGVAFGYFTSAAVVGIGMSTDSTQELGEAKSSLERSIAWGEARNTPWTFSVQNELVGNDEHRVGFELFAPSAAIEALVRGSTPKRIAPPP